MNENDIKTLQQKLAITDAATRLYVAQNGHFTLHNVAKQADLTVGELFNFFGNKQQILDFFYTSLIIRYRLMIDEIEDFSSFTLSEKLSNFAYASFDMMEEREEFVAQTFRSQVWQRCRKTDYEQKIETLFKDFVENDDGKAASSDFLVNDYTLPIIRKKYLTLVNFWLNDDSEGKEMSIELIDKVTGLIQELLYNSVIDRSADIAKFFFSNNLISQQCPGWEKLNQTFQIN